MHLQTEEQLQAVNFMTVSLRRKKTKHFLRQFVSFSRSEKNWLKTSNCGPVLLRLPSYAQIKPDSSIPQKMLPLLPNPLFTNTR